MRERKGGRKVREREVGGKEGGRREEGRREGRREGGKGVELEHVWVPSRGALYRMRTHTREQG